jgi:hypothetical protein
LADTRASYLVSTVKSARRGGSAVADCYSAVMPNPDARGSRSGPWRWLLIVLVPVVVVGGVWLGVASRHPSSGSGTAPPVSTVPLIPTAGALRVTGNQVLDATGSQYVPYGFVVWCLSSPDLSCTRHSASNPNTDADKIRAAATYWHANTVRIQVAWQHLFVGSGTTVDQTYLAQLDSEVALAASLHMVAIVTLQTERYNGSVMPDAHAVSFWDTIARHYAGNQSVLFDLFNEPRLNPKRWPGFTEAGMWDIWQNGGSVTLTGDSAPTTFVGMQQLVDTVRATGAGNVVVAEGNQTDHDLSMLPQHALSGVNITYGMEPDLGRGTKFPYADDTHLLWSTNWGTLSATYPLMMEAFQDYPGASLCNPRSPQLFPKLLTYLRADHLGLLFYSLDPGIGVVGHDLQHPTSFDGVTRFDCSADLATNSAGPGAELLAWFQANSRPVGG